MENRFKITAASHGICAIAKRSLGAAGAVLLLTSGVVNAQHPDPQPRIGMESPENDGEFTVSPDGKTTTWKTKRTHFEPSNPFRETPGNLLPTIYELARDSAGNPVPNTLPSTPERPYNLHNIPSEEDGTIVDIDPRSPRWDLGVIINHLKAAVDKKDREATNQEFFAGGIGVPADPRRGHVERKENQGPGVIEEEATPEIDFDLVQFGIDILEGNPIDRAYTGMPLLKYTGPAMVKKIDPETRTVTVRMAWQQGRMSSDAMFIDPCAMTTKVDENGEEFQACAVPGNVPWKIRYEINTLRWGHEDFAPFVVTFDNPPDGSMPRPNIPLVGFDQTFFPMEEGKKYIFEMDMPPHRYWNLTYHWGWRVHPPRIQAAEKALKKPMGRNIVGWEREVFCADGEPVKQNGNVVDWTCPTLPNETEEAKLAAIDMLSDLAPAKRMWKALRAIQSFQGTAVADTPQNGKLRILVAELEASYEDWKDRTKLPRGIEDAEGFDQTLAYVNNVLYGGQNNVINKAELSWSKWETRGETLKTKIYNGDYFPHAYMNVDFGGRRGWENTFQNTIALGDQGPWFTFGRAHWDRNLSTGLPQMKQDANGDPFVLPPGPKPVLVPAATRPKNDLSSPGLDALGMPGHAQDVRQLLETVGEPGQSRNVAALPAATQAAMQSKWMQHPGNKIAVHRNFIGLGEHNVEITYRFEPSTRLRFYQFDPLHHNEAILSTH